MGLARNRALMPHVGEPRGGVWNTSVQVLVQILCRAILDPCSINVDNKFDLRVFADVKSSIFRHLFLPKGPRIASLAFGYGLNDFLTARQKSCVHRKAHGLTTRIAMGLRKGYSSRGL